MSKIGKNSGKSSANGINLRKSPARGENSRKPPDRQDIRLSDEDTNRVARHLSRSGTFWWRFLGVALPALFVSHLTLLKSCVEPGIERHVNSYQTNQISYLTEKLEDSLKHVELSISNRMDAKVASDLDAAYQDITNRTALRISTEFQDFRIRKTISDVASNQAKVMMEQEIAPKVTMFANDLAALRIKAETNYAELKDTSDVAILIVKAMADDRYALDELLRSHGVSPSRFSSLAYNVLYTISEKLSYDAHTRNIVLDVWKNTTNSPATASITAYSERYSSFVGAHSVLPRMYLIYELYHSDRLAKRDKIDFLVEVLNKESSLQCVAEACFCMGKESGLGDNIINLPHMLKWWETNRSNYISK